MKQSRYVCIGGGIALIGAFLFIVFSVTLCDSSNDPFTSEVITDSTKLALLLRNGLNPDTRNRPPQHEDTLLYFAVRHSAHDSAKLLIDAGAKVDDTSPAFKKSPLFEAAYMGDLKMAQILITAGANVNASDIFGNICLRDAILSKKSSMVSYLIRSGADVHHVNNEGKTLSDIANEFSSPEIQQLIQKACQVPKTTNSN